MRVLVVTGTRAGLFGERLEALKREIATAELVITGGYGKTDLQAAWLARKRGCHVIEVVLGCVRSQCGPSPQHRPGPDRKALPGRRALRAVRRVSGRRQRHAGLHHQTQSTGHSGIGVQPMSATVSTTSGTFREPASDPIWQARAELLARLMGGRACKALELTILGRDFGWSDDQTRNVMAAGEGTWLYEHRGVWMRASRQP